MTLNLNLQLTPPRTLKVVLTLRGIAIAAQLTVLGLAVYAFNLPLPVKELLWGAGFLTVSALALWWRLRHAWLVTELEVSLHLLLDIGVLTWLLYFSGGSSNPFVSAYLVPIALAAVALPALYSLAVAASCIGAYTFLLRFNIPLPMMGGPAGGFELHVMGMWVNFILSACLMVGLLGLMAANIRRRDELISRAREDTLRNEHITSLGALAAGAAHELSTPLSTVALIADELEIQCKGNPSAQADLKLLKEQVNQCKVTLTTLLDSAGQKRPESSGPIDLDAFLEDILQRWRLLRPDIKFNAALTGEEDLNLLPEHGLSQMLINLLNNAAEASLAAGNDRVELNARRQDEGLIIEIRDHGTGIDEATRQIAGKQIFSTKTEGAGLGLLLSNATLNRFGGTLSLHDCGGGGTLTRVALPLENLKVTHAALAGD